eukprot:m.13437 g.13437  ORF g.13437 m.13437 type:complete len:50 (+) comp10156_c0_seq1:839-988(+)
MKTALSKAVASLEPLQASLGQVQSVVELMPTVTEPGAIAVHLKVTFAIE